MPMYTCNIYIYIYIERERGKKVDLFQFCNNVCGPIAGLEAIACHMLQVLQG